jgi:hypothetical protein
MQSVGRGASDCPSGPFLSSRGLGKDAESFHRRVQRGNALWVRAVGWADDAARTAGPKLRTTELNTHLILETTQTIGSWMVSAARECSTPSRKPHSGGTRHGR